MWLKCAENPQFKPLPRKWGAAFRVADRLGAVDAFGWPGAVAVWRRRGGAAAQRSRGKFLSEAYPAPVAKVLAAPGCSFQSLLLRLSSFWSERGCVLVQPYDMEVGAGTFHPATALRALGPEAWRAAYVQASRRPTDGRYGQNPNRLQHYYQFQVVLKPSPNDGQELYLSSLEALGLARRDHDIRFIEDNWESPTLGAWGLGWEVWCDGMEVSQFTYFQQIGGMDCRPVTIEITYGLERLAMYIQGVESVFALDWDGVPTKEGGKSYGDLYLQAEWEFSTYNFHCASIEVLERHFADAQHSCSALLAHDPPLSLPAYEQCLRASHLFNLRDARGVVSPTQRPAEIAQVRALACACCRAWVERRSQLAADGLRESSRA